MPVCVLGARSQVRVTRCEKNRNAIAKSKGGWNMESFAGILFAILVVKVFSMNRACQRGVKGLHGTIESSQHNKCHMVMDFAS